MLTIGPACTELGSFGWIGARGGFGLGSFLATKCVLGVVSGDFWVRSVIFFFSSARVTGHGGGWRTTEQSRKDGRLRGVRDAGLVGGAAIIPKTS